MAPRRGSASRPVNPAVLFVEFDRDIPAQVQSHRDAHDRLVRRSSHHRFDLGFDIRARVQIGREPLVDAAWNESDIGAASEDLNGTLIVDLRRRIARREAFSIGPSRTAIDEFWT